MISSKQFLTGSLLKSISTGMVGVGIFISSIVGMSAQEKGVPFSFPEGLSANLYAREPMLKNPVGLSVGSDRTVYVTETQRRKAQNLDIRSNADWIETELSLQTVAQKKAFYLSTLTAENSNNNKRRVADHNGDGIHDWRDLTVLSEFIHALKDKDGDGYADSATVFAGGFKTPVTGVAGGVLSWGGDVYANVAPDVWKLTDTDNDGIADKRRSIAYGFANHIAYGGHNTHGVTIGLDGRIYWSIGDTGSDYTPHEGAVFRCEPDGSNLEVFAAGLRNPQEIVFDDFGNMFTGDNDADFGDRERWYYVVEGGDYGWRFWWQYQRGRNWKAPDSNYSVWMNEKLWHERFDGQSAFIIPAIKLIDNGPCGMAAYPGVGMPPEFKNSFVLAHFTGSPGNSGLRRYKLESLGADFDLTEDKKIISGSVITGVDFAPDGSGLFFADWGGSWPLNDAGRVYRVVHDKYSNASVVRQSHRLLNGGIDSLVPDQLKPLLAHDNRNVRREAQFKLTRSGMRGRKALLETLKSSNSQLARVHAVLGLDMIARKKRSVLPLLVPFLHDNDSEIRFQVARSLGDNQFVPAGKELISILSDEGSNNRARAMAMMALGKIGNAQAMEPVLDILESNASKDLVVRHAGIMYLKGLKDYQKVSDLVSHSSPHVRMAAVVALRKMENPHVAKFLNDPDLLIVVEAARAINDVPLESARPSLAALLHPQLKGEALVRRVLNAHYRIGHRENLQAMVEYAASPDAPDFGRIEAVKMLRQWHTIIPRDRVCGGWFPIGSQSLASSQRSPGMVAAEVSPHLFDLLAGNDELALESIRLIEELEINVKPDVLHGWVADESNQPPVRLAALNLLARTSSPHLTSAVNSVLSSQDPSLKSRALVLLSKTNPSITTRILDDILDAGTTPQKQAVIRSLTEIKIDSAQKHISRLASDLARGRLEPQLNLDVYRSMENAEKENVDGVKASLSRFVANQQRAGDSGIYFSLATAGGNARKGAEIFTDKVELACVRCHQVPDSENPGQLIGGTMGPNLKGISRKKSADYLAHALLDPNRDFADGFEMVTVTMASGEVYSGRILEDSASRIILELPAGVSDAANAEDEFDFDADEESSAETVRVTLAKKDVASSARGISAMPPGLHHLMTLEEFRDLIAFLQSL